MKKIAIFGDSLTAGFNGITTTDILKIKVEENLQKKAEVLLFGLPGDDSKKAVKRLSKVRDSHADLNLIFFGTNDASASHLISLARFEKNLQFILNQLENQPVLLTPPCVDEKVVSAHRSNQRVEQYRAVILKLAQTEQLPLVDLYPLSLQDPAAFLQSDGIHLTVAGYEQLAQLIAQTVAAYL